jgi:hypothetical protein
MGCKGKSASVRLTSDILHYLTRISRCFGHVVNIANVAVMSHITKVAVIETTSAIWEYDPSLPDNRVLNGSLDVIASVRTAAIKVSNLNDSDFLV